MSEVVCVAGVRLNGERPEWIRLFPVPFRDLPATARFKKYDVISLGVRRGSDRRPESFHPELHGLHVLRTIKTDRKGLWTERREAIDRLIGETTMCGLCRANVGGGPAPSLGLVKPAEILDVLVEKNPGFNEERKRLAEIVSEETLLGAVKAELEPAPYLVKYRYRCLDDKCKGHEQSLLDWEVGEAGRSWSSQYPGAGRPTTRAHRRLLRRLLPDAQTVAAPSLDQRPPGPRSAGGTVQGVASSHGQAAA
jgi:hypothetical protein